MAFRLLNYWYCIFKIKVLTASVHYLSHIVGSLGSCGLTWKPTLGLPGNYSVRENVFEVQIIDLQSAEL